MALPQNIDSKFRFILVVAKRTRQLQAGAKALVQTQAKKLTRVARQEVEAGLVPFELIEIPASDNGSAKKGKSTK
jgi:DNA-directed RNA polymerase subunit omega